MTQKAYEAVKFIHNCKPGFKPRVAIILGSGSGEVIDAMNQPTVIPYTQIPGFPECRVEGHGGQLYLGNLHGVDVAFLQGRVHMYEGIAESTLIIRTVLRTMKLLGCEILVQNNAAGSFHEEVPAGDLMLVTDHINFQFTNPLIGLNDDDFGGRFVGMEDAYNPALRERFLMVAKKLNIKLAQGVLLTVSGPCFETPAEIRAFRVLGADAVGMSTAPETIIARHCGLKVAAVTTITNLAAGLNVEPLSHEQTLRGAKLAVDNLTKLLFAFLDEKAYGKL